MLSLHPAREGVLTDIDWLKRDENFLKKKFQKVLVIKKKVLLLHPLTQRATLEREAHKLREQVHRHIGLTAYKNKSKSFSSIIKNWIPSKMIIVDKIN